MFASLILSSTHTALAQDLFTYEDEDKTIINGVTSEGIGYIIEEHSLTIPNSIVKVNANAFASVKANGISLYELIIDGGNPIFELSDNKNALADVNDDLSLITIHGSNMSTENLGKLLMGSDIKDKDKPVNGFKLTVDIDNSDFPLDANIHSTSEDEETRNAENKLIDDNTEGVQVILPAARVDTQKFGKADIYGRFMLTSEIITFCGRQLFYDKDDGSQFLFYIPTEVSIDPNDGEKKLHIKRVRYIFPNQGVLLHKKEGSSPRVVLPRISVDDIEDDTQYNADNSLYASNMLQGIIEPTKIGSTTTKDDVEYTNMILYNGLFYRTSGGTLGANRAYLQIRNTDLEGLSKLAMFVTDDEEVPTGIKGLEGLKESTDHCVYDLFGRKITGNNILKPGIYIYKGKKVRIHE